MRDSLVALAGIPFALVGGIIALYISGLNFSISAAIGFISLFGVSAMDGILNITYFRELRLRGLEVTEAVFQGSEQRMRPMLMTALSAGIGLFPAAISTGIGSQVQKPLATVVVGGMIIGPIMLLVVAPVIRKLFLGKDEFVRRPHPPEDEPESPDEPDEPAAAAPPSEPPATAVEPPPQAPPRAPPQDAPRPPEEPNP